MDWYQSDRPHIRKRCPENHCKRIKSTSVDNFLDRNLDREELFWITICVSDQEGIQLYQEELKEKFGWVGEVVWEVREMIHSFIILMNCFSLFSLRIIDRKIFLYLVDDHILIFGSLLEWLYSDTLYCWDQWEQNSPKRLRFKGKWPHKGTTPPLRPLCMEIRLQGKVHSCWGTLKINSWRSTRLPLELSLSRLDLIQNERSSLGIPTF